MTVKRVSSAGGIVTYTIRIDLNQLTGEGLSEEGTSLSNSWHGQEPGSEEAGD